MSQAPEKQAQSPEPEAAEAPDPRPPDQPAAPEDAPEDPKSAFHARIAAARARVNALLARANRPPLPEWPLPEPPDDSPDGPNSRGEASALEFLETVANPEFYRNCPPEVARSGLGGGIRAGLQELAEVRGAPRPDFTEEYRALGMKDPDTGKVPGASAAEGARLFLAKAQRRKAFDQASYECAEAHGGLMPFSLDPPPYGKPLPRLPDPAEGRADFALPEAPALSESPAPPPDETEALLNGVIADCRLFLREIVFHSARLAALESDRSTFIQDACRMAKTAGGVGKEIARLRRAANTDRVGENRQRIIVERVERIPARVIVEGEGVREK